MDKFLMVCYVAADFPGPGEVFRVTAKDVGVFVEAPVWVKDTLIYKMLVNDGSIRVGETKEEVKKLENDPMEGIGADGKATDEAVEEPKPIIKVRETKRKKKVDAE